MNSARSHQDEGPLEERLKSKNFKVKMTAYSDLAQKYKDAESENDPIFGQYASQLHKYINENNPAAQENAILALKNYLERVTELSIDVKNTLKTLVDKAIGPGKPNIKLVSMEVLLLIFEKGDKEVVFGAITDQIANKNQKTSCAGV
mmetsp:Transcript_27959/g.24628  ORF Transcript_27959/g.24628 Transcript_27959/m.24628 type:complete len:147 (-) Transcript_27959:2448-2888(-)